MSISIVLSNIPYFLPVVYMKHASCTDELDQIFFFFFSYSMQLLESVYTYIIS